MWSMDIVLCTSCTWRVHVVFGCSQAGIAAAPARAVSAVKEMNIPQRIKDIKLPDLPSIGSIASKFWYKSPVLSCHAPVKNAHTDVVIVNTTLWLLVCCGNWFNHWCEIIDNWTCFFLILALAMLIFISLGMPLVEAIYVGPMGSSLATCQTDQRLFQPLNLTQCR